MDGVEGSSTELVTSTTLRPTPAATPDVNTIKVFFSSWRISIVFIFLFLKKKKATGAHLVLNSHIE